MRKLNLDYWITIIMVLHDMNHAVYYSDEVIGLKNGKVLLQGCLLYTSSRNISGRMSMYRLWENWIPGIRNAVLSWISAI